jgi:hypothetical protein
MQDSVQNLRWDGGRWDGGRDAKPASNGCLVRQSASTLALCTVSVLAVGECPQAAHAATFDSDADGATTAARAPRAEPATPVVAIAQPERWEAMEQATVDQLALAPTDPAPTDLSPADLSPTDLVVPTALARTTQTLVAAQGGLAAPIPTEIGDAITTEIAAEGVAVEPVVAAPATDEIVAAEPIAAEPIAAESSAAKPGSLRSADFPFPTLLRAENAVIRANASRRPTATAMIKVPALQPPRSRTAASPARPAAEKRLMFCWPDFPVRGFHSGAIEIRMMHGTFYTVRSFASPA